MNVDRTTKSQIARTETSTLETLLHFIQDELLKREVAEVQEQADLLFKLTWERMGAIAAEQRLGVPGIGAKVMAHLETQGLVRRQEGAGRPCWIRNA